MIGRQVTDPIERADPDNGNHDNGKHCPAETFPVRGLDLPLFSGGLRASSDKASDRTDCRKNDAKPEGAQSDRAMVVKPDEDPSRHQNKDPQT